jgi:homoserine O-acetyltransferase
MISIFQLNQSHALESGGILDSVEIGYSISGVPRDDGSNVIIICHTLTGGIDIVSSRFWWFVGEGKLIDPNEFCVISMATLGSWHGSSSPSNQRNVQKDKQRLDFPTITVTDSVNAHRQLLRSLGIRRARALIGGSFGGFCAYTWLTLEPNLFDVALIFQSALRCSAHTIAFFALARELICTDPAWSNGNYNRQEVIDMPGVKQMLALNRLLQFSHAHFEARFPPEIRYPQNAQQTSFAEPWSPVDTFVLGDPKSVKELDPADFLCLTRSSALFDLHHSFPDLSDRWRRLRTKTIHIPCIQDWRYPVEGMEVIHHHMRELGLDSHMLVSDSPYGHGSFLHDPASIKPFLPFLEQVMRDA